MTRTHPAQPTPAYAPSPWDFVAEQVSQYEASGGREAGDFAGKPVVILTTVGRKTGRLRKSPLMRYSDGVRYAVVAGKIGAPTHPEWYLNLLDNPEVTIQDGDQVVRCSSYVAAGEERAAWWTKAVAEVPDLVNYQANTDRQFPVVILEPLGTQP